MGTKSLKFLLIPNVSSVEVFDSPMNSPDIPGQHINSLSLYNCENWSDVPPVSRIERKEDTNSQHRIFSVYRRYVDYRKYE